MEVSWGITASVAMRIQELAKLKTRTPLLSFSMIKKKFIKKEKNDMVGNNPSRPIEPFLFFKLNCTRRYHTHTHKRRKKKMIKKKKNRLSKTGSIT